MNRDMPVMDVGGKIAVVLVVSLAVTAGISYVLRPLFMITADYRTLAVAGIALAAFRVFVKEEERYLDEKFGGQYREYRKRVLFKI